MLRPLPPRSRQTTSRSYVLEATSNKATGFSQTIGAASTAVSYSYNANGDLTSDGLRIFRHDAEGRLATAATGSDDASATTRYAHNALGQRVFKTEAVYPVQGSSASVLSAFFAKGWTPDTVDAEKLGYAFVYDKDGMLLSETGMGGASSGGSTQYVYLPTPSGPMPVAAVINGVMYAVQSDHLNTPRRITSGSGEVLWQWGYSAFGDEAPTTAAKRFTSANTTPATGTTNATAIDFKLRFPGQVADAESGLFYNYFRSYDARTGRYSQPDPIGLDGGWNRFGYVDSNPLSFIDPTGLDRTDYLNSSGGRSLFNGPSNGNWGGKCWSGGNYSCKGNPVGGAPPADSGDACYQRHDLCYVACTSNAGCRTVCDKKLVDELRALPDDPRKWPRPPRPGTEADSRQYRDSAIGSFR